MCPRCHGVGHVTSVDPTARGHGAVARRGRAPASRCSTSAAGPGACTPRAGCSTTTSRSDSPPDGDGRCSSTARGVRDGQRLDRHAPVPRQYDRAVHPRSYGSGWTQGRRLAHGPPRAASTASSREAPARTATARGSAGRPARAQSTGAPSPTARARRRRARDVVRRSTGPTPRPWRRARRAARRLVAASASATSRSTVRPARCRAASRSASRWCATSPAASSSLMYVFDEPTVGLHPARRRPGHLAAARLRDRGNTVLVVEHDPDVILAADHVVDVGPGPGPRGGTIVFEGTSPGLAARRTRPTGGTCAARPCSTASRARRPADAARAGGDRQQPAATSTSTSPPACSSRSPASRARASRRSDATGWSRSTRRGGRRTSRRSAPRSARARPPTPASWTRSAHAFADAHTACPARCSASTPRAPARSARAAASSRPSCRSSTRCARLPGVRGQPVPPTRCSSTRSTACTSPTCSRSGRRGARALRPCRRSTGASQRRRRRPRLPDARPAAQHAVRRRGAAASSSRPSSARARRRVRARRADHRAAHGRRGDLVGLLDRMVDAGNTVIVVEHDLDVVAAPTGSSTSGPGAGRHGGFAL